MKAPAHARGHGAFMLPGRPGRLFRLRAGLRQKLARERPSPCGGVVGFESAATSAEKPAAVHGGVASHRVMRRFCDAASSEIWTALARASACPGEDLSHVVRGVFVFGPRRSPKKSPQRSGLRVPRRAGRRAKKSSGIWRQIPEHGSRILLWETFVLKAELSLRGKRDGGTRDIVLCGEAGRFASEGPGRVLWGRALSPMDRKIFQGRFFRNRPAGSWGRRIFSWPGCICRS